MEEQIQTSGSGKSKLPERPICWWNAQINQISSQTVGISNTKNRYSWKLYCFTPASIIIVQEHSVICKQYVWNYGKTTKMPTELNVGWVQIGRILSETTIFQRESVRYFLKLQCGKKKCEVLGNYIELTAVEGVHLCGNGQFCQACSDSWTTKLHTLFFFIVI